MGKIAVVGNKETVLIFKALGVNVFEVTANDELSRLKSALNGEFKIVFVTENVYKTCEDVIKKHLYDSSVVITVIPNAKKSESVGIKELRKATIEAISTDILAD